MASLPAKTVDKPTEAQKAVRRRFARAVQYAQQILLKPGMQAAYKARAREGRPPFIVAMSDFLNGPVVEEIDATDYMGNPGDLIRVKASDDFKVIEVSMMIQSAGGEIVETGPCQLNTLGIWWEYTTTETIASLPCTEIIATARDIPGNKGTGNVTL